MTKESTIRNFIVSSLIIAIITIIICTGLLIYGTDRVSNEVFQVIFAGLFCMLCIAAILFIIGFLLAKDKDSKF